jgi:predicted nucleic acid-binding protein
MDKNHIFVDTNVLIGAIENYAEDVRCLRFLHTQRHRKQLYISALTVAQVVAMYQRKKTPNELRKIVHDLMVKFHIVEFTKADIVDALTIDNADMEDNIQIAISKKVKCRYIITNDAGLLRNVNISAVRPYNAQGLYTE